jgi:hypothetical protein
MDNSDDLVRGFLSIGRCIIVAVVAVLFGLGVLAGAALF